jgi:hypothetical protein
VKDEIGIRPVQGSDLSHIYATWLRACRTGSKFAKGIPNDVFFPSHSKVVERILKRPNTRTLIAHLKTDPDIILGYLVTEKRPDLEIVHFMFVKMPFRKLGILNELVQFSGVDLARAHCSHWTFDLLQLSKTYQQMTYNPYLM